MLRRRGFTIVELVIVMVIMAILLVLGTVSFSSVQLKARDNERKTDIAVIARGLEVRYKDGNPVVTAPSYVARGSYPSTMEMQHILGVNQATFTPAQITGGYATTALPGTQLTTFLPPGISSGGFNIICTSSCGAAANYSAIAAITTKDTYVYEPVNTSGNICMTGECTQFNLYWRSEAPTDDTNLPLPADTTFHRQGSSRQ